MKTQLLCTFTNIHRYTTLVDELAKFYKIVFNKVYALQNIDNLDEILLTYNINADSIENTSFFEDTISVHRKKDFNTIYTINSLNNLIKSLNNNILDTNFIVDWNLFRNSILLTDGVTGYKKIPTKLFRIINV